MSENSVVLEYNIVGKQEYQSSNTKYDEYTDSEQSNVSESMKEIYKV